MLICFDIGGSRIKAGLSHRAGAVEPLGEAATPLDDFEAFVAVLAEMVAPYRGEVLGVSIATAGCVDPDTGVLVAANIASAHGHAIGPEIAAALGLPVWVANDADCFALAEAGSGAGIGHRNVFGVILGSGVGGGLIIDGRIITGAGGYAGEWGHGPVLNTRLEALGLEIPHFACGCGQSGCVDTVGGARGLERLYLHMFGTQLTSTGIIGDWLADDPAARLVLEAWLELVSGPLAMVLNVTGSSVVPVGGGLASVPGLIGMLDAAVRARILRKTAGPLLVPAQHLIEPGLIGASLAGFQGLAERGGRADG